MGRSRRTPVRIKEAHCRCCGCTEAEACAGWCHWVLVDREKGWGICSSCEPLIQRAIQILQEQARRLVSAR